jgi:hypothetical protein
VVTQALRALLALLLAAGAFAAARPGAAQEATEQQVKAAFLYRFAGYVEWPDASFAQADSPLVIGVLGDEPLAAAVEQAVGGRSVNGRRVTARRVRPGESIAGVHILFVGRAERGRLPQIAQGASAQAVLVVTETEGALAQGSVINFLVADRRVRFEISLPSAERSGLKLSSRLLAVAAQVHGGPQ